MRFAYTNFFYLYQDKYVVVVAGTVTLAPAFLWSIIIPGFMIRLRIVTLFDPDWAMLTALLMIVVPQLDGKVLGDSIL